MIPRPTGRWGRPGKGFSIREAMGYSTQKEEYNRIMATVRRASCKHLDMSIHFSAQRDDAIDEVVRLTTDNHPALEGRYTDDWAVRVLIEQYLTNAQAPSRRASRARSRAEPVELQPFPMPSPTPKVNEDASHALRPASESIDSATLRQEIQASREDMDQAVDPDTTICPHLDCMDAIPMDPNRALQRQLVLRKRLLQKTGAGMGAVLMINSSICATIRFQTTLLPLAKSEGWPLRFDPDQFVARIRALRDSLEPIVDNARLSFVWPLLVRAHFGATISVLAGAFVRNPNADVLRALQHDTRVGYYGEQGEILIACTLATMFPALADHSDSFDPLSPEAFMRWILVPQCAILLILEDRAFVDHDLTLSEAFDVMMTSANYGYHRFRTDRMRSARLDRVLSIQDAAFKELRVLRHQAATQASMGALTPHVASQT